MPKTSINQVAGSARGHKELFQGSKKIQASQLSDIRFGLDKEVFVITATKPDGRFTTIKVFPNGDITERYTGEKQATKIPNPHSSFVDLLAGYIGNKLTEMLHITEPYFGDDGRCLCGLDLGFHSD